MARKMGLTGVHTMRKDQLVRALVKAAKAKQSSTAGSSTATSSRRSNGQKKRVMSETEGAASAAARSGAVAKRPTSSAEGTPKRVGRHATKMTQPKTANARIIRKIHQLHAQRETQRDLSHASVLAAKNGRKKKAPKPKPTPVPGKDRIVLLVRDPYWLQACWDVTRQSVARAKAALAEHWHTSRPILRLMQVEAGSTTGTSERIVREIPVHGGVKNWYVDIKDSPNSYRVELGYRGENGRFFVLSRSNVVTTPRPGSIDAIDENWADIAENYEKIYALSGGYEPSTAGGDLQDLFEEQLRRPMGNPLGSQLSAEATEPALRRDKDFNFEVDAEMIIYGATKPGAHVTLAGEPVKLRHDGTFTVRLSMPDRRQLLPVVASSRDGAEQRTIVLAVERNTKVMEPMTRESTP